mmetsp:Transcript_12257/g.38839  ORF Transcript_12257/g.38839 Transcript_12257/m.38839 type:complete len:257 (-) Transcript_12257:79-849(-)
MVHPLLFIDASIPGWWKVSATYMDEHHDLLALIIAAYLCIIFGGKMFMKDRPAFGLRVPLAVWSAGLSLFSIVASWNIYWTLRSPHSWTDELCSYEAEQGSPWFYLFVLSKLPELVDTFFIVARKKPLIFLHWYHHVATLAYCWISWGQQIPYGSAFALMNTIVHSFMYAYYAAAACGVRFPKLIRVSITALQIFQMAAGVAINVTVLRVCDHPHLRTNIYYSLAMYASYFVLFTRFFLTAYLAPPAKSSVAKKTD